MGDEEQIEGVLLGPDELNWCSPMSVEAKLTEPICASNVIDKS